MKIKVKETLRVPSDDITFGRNRSRRPYSDSNYYRCWNCGFICQSDRDAYSYEGERTGDGLKLPDTEVASAISVGDSTITVNSTTGFPSSGYIYIYPEASGAANGVNVDRIAYTGIGSTTFTGCTEITLAHDTDSIVRGENTVKSGCPGCGTLLYKGD